MVQRSAWLVVLVASAVAAQPGSVIAPARADGKTPPVFGADNPEGLEYTGSTTNGVHTIRQAWKRRLEWKVNPPSERPLLDSAKLAPPPTPAERQEMTRTLNAALDVLRATPAGSSGEGFWVSATQHFDTFDGRRLPKGSWAKHPLEFSTTVAPFAYEDVLQPNGSWKLSVKGETDAPALVFNRLPGKPSTGVLVVAEEPGGGDRPPVQLYLRPRVVDRFRDLPIYDEELNGGTLLVVTRPGRDPWAPVSLARALKAALPRFEADKLTAERRLANQKAKLAEVEAPAWERAKREAFEKTYGGLRTSKPSSWETRLASHENELKVLREQARAEANPGHDAKGAWYWNPIEAWKKASSQLSALSPADGARPACFLKASESVDAMGVRPSDGRYEMKGDLVPGGSSPECREVVETNFGYWDLSRPRTAPQLLTIHNFLRCGNVQKGEIVIPPVSDFRNPPSGCVQVRRMWKDADWVTLRALVER